MPVFNRISGGNIITDANLLPEDAESGKIFYNNDGKQVGTGKALQHKTFSFKKGDTVTVGSTAKSLSMGYIELTNAYDEIVKVPAPISYYYITSQSIQLDEKVFSIDFTIDGKTYHPTLYEDKDNPLTSNQAITCKLNGEVVNIADNIPLTFHWYQGMTAYYRILRSTVMYVGLNQRKGYSGEVLHDIDITVYYR